MLHIANKDAVACDIGDDMALLNLESGTYFTINQTASLLWSMLQEPRSVNELCEALTSKYDVSLAASLVDVEVILQEFRDVGLIDEAKL